MSTSLQGAFPLLSPRACEKVEERKLLCLVGHEDEAGILIQTF